MNYEGQEKTRLRKLTECAILIAAAVILNFIKIYKLPLGGAVTAVSMLPILLAGYRNGLKWGMLTGMTYAVLQILLDMGELSSWGLTPVVFVGALVFDYLLAYGGLGLSGLFKGKKHGIFIAAVFCLTFRFAMHLISGVLLFSSWRGEGYTPLGWSVVYNGAYMLPELVFTLLVLLLLVRIPGVIPRREGE